MDGGAIEGIEVIRITNSVTWILEYHEIPPSQIC